VCDGLSLVRTRCSNDDDTPSGPAVGLGGAVARWNEDEDGGNAERERTAKRATAMIRSAQRRCFSAKALVARGSGQRDAGFAVRS
jgi:hypothetical protein